MQTILLVWTLNMVLAQGAGTPQTSQTQQGSIHGKVTIFGTAEAIPGAEVTLHVASESQALTSILNAVDVQGGSRAEVAAFLSELSKAPPEVFEAEMESAAAEGAPRAIISMLAEMRLQRRSNPAFPMQTVADSAGNFIFSDVPAGRYTLMVHSDGFFGSSADGKSPLPDVASLPVTVTAEENPASITVPLSPGAVIAGRVSDSSGRPLAHVGVQAIATGSQAGRSGFGYFPTRMTDDRGEYRLFWLQPGEYVIGVNPRQSSASSAAENGAPQEREIRTYYPSAADMTSATRVAVKIGEERGGLDITMRTGLPSVISTVTPPRGVKVSGNVIDALPHAQTAPVRPGALPKGVAVTLMLARRDGKSSLTPVGNVSLNSSSREFELNGILPGSYDLYARIADPLGSPGRGGGVDAWGRASIDVPDHDLDGVTLVVHPSVDVMGLVKVIDSGSAADAGALQIALQPEGTSAKDSSFQGVMDRPQTPDPDGAFTISAVAEGAYSFQVRGLSADFYVADIRQNGASVLETEFYVADRKPAPVEVILAGNGGIVEGTAFTADQKPAPSAMVALVPTSPHRRNQNLYKFVTTDSQGRFALSGVRPDEYTLFASEGIPSDVLQDSELLSSMELLSRMDLRGTVVRVTPSSTTSVQVYVSSK